MEFVEERALQSLVIFMKYIRLDILSFHCPLPKECSRLFALCLLTGWQSQYSSIYTLLQISRRAQWHNQAKSSSSLAFICVQISSISVGSSSVWHGHTLACLSFVCSSS